MSIVQVKVDDLQYNSRFFLTFHFIWKENIKNAHKFIYYFLIMETFFCCCCVIWQKKEKLQLKICRVVFVSIFCFKMKWNQMEEETSNVEKQLLEKVLFCFLHFYEKSFCGVLWTPLQYNQILFYSFFCIFNYTLLQNCAKISILRVSTFLISILTVSLMHNSIFWTLSGIETSKNHS